MHVQTRRCVEQRSGDDPGKRETMADKEAVDGLEKMDDREKIR